MAAAVSYRIVEHVRYVSNVLGPSLATLIQKFLFPTTTIAPAILKRYRLSSS